MTGNFREDVNNPLFITAEERGKRWLRSRWGFASILDNRSKHQHYDFIARMGSEQARKVDVKADQYFTETGRLAFEMLLHYHGGEQGPGWMQKDLDYIFYIDPHGTRGVLVDANRVRPALQTSTGYSGWKRFLKRNVSCCDAEGWAVPIEHLVQLGAVTYDGEVPR